MSEEWKPISREEFKEIIEVSNKGNIRYIKTKKPCSTHIKGGYKAVCLSNNRKTCVVSVQRIVAETFLGSQPISVLVVHKDKDKFNNHLDNLEWKVMVKKVENNIVICDVPDYPDIEEVWKDVPEPDFCDHMEVSNKGNVRNKTSRNKNCSQHNRNGYKAVCLYSKTTKKKHTVNVHRLVANTFIEKLYEEQDQVNHKDGNKHNNCIVNLEWTSACENNRHAIKNNLATRHFKSVLQLSEDGIILNKFSSIKSAAEKLGICPKSLGCALNKGEYNKDGYIWKFEISKQIVDIPKGKVISNYPNYIITETGEIFSIRSRKFMTPKILSSGYATIKLCNNGKKQDFYIHKLVREYYNIEYIPPEERASSPKPFEKSLGGSGENSEV